jgi:hypothetical protein
VREASAPCSAAVARESHFGRAADVALEPDVRRSVGLVGLDRRPEPLLPRALIATARETDIAALLDADGARTGGG